MDPCRMRVARTRCTGNLTAGCKGSGWMHPVRVKPCARLHVVFNKPVCTGVQGAVPALLRRIAIGVLRFVTQAVVWVSA